MALIASVGIRDRVPRLPVPLVPNVLKICNICVVKPLLDRGDEQFVMLHLVILSDVYRTYMLRLRSFSVTCLINTIKCGNKSTIGNPIMNCRTGYAHMKVKITVKTKT